MNRIAVRFAYHGDGFSGSQIQPGARTVEGEMRSALLKVCHLADGELDLRIASRTDKGVSATGNVASFESGGADPVNLLKALNSVHGGVLCTAYTKVDDGFTPRHADRRTYEYVAKARGLDADVANECLSMFRGRRDFSGFCKAEGKDPVIDLTRADAVVDGDVLIMTFEADHFLWNMVRRISAAVLRAASGRMPVSRIEEALAGGWSNFGIAPAEGLTLTDVFYDGLDFTPSPDPALAYRKADGLYSARLAERFYGKLRREPRSQRNPEVRGFEVVSAGLPAWRINAWTWACRSSSRASCRPR